MKRRLYLIDAHAYLHRAYHALPALTNDAKEPVGALYGFARMLIQLLKKEKPDLTAVCFDLPGPTFRHELYRDYKATRAKIDDDLLIQLRQAPELAKAMGFSCVAIPGYEADDVMATLAKSAEKEGIEAVLVTGDKDALQIVGDGIRVLRDVAKGDWLDAGGVQKKLGVLPRSVVDYLALVGDAADNVPGVSGIGSVTAVKLINQYGSLMEIFKAAKSGDASLSPKAARALIEGEESAEMAVRLLKLKEDIPLPIAVSDCAYPHPDSERLKAVFSRFGFNSLLHDLIPDALEIREVSIQTLESATIVEVPFDELKEGLGKTNFAVVAAFESDENGLNLALALPDRRVSFLNEAAVESEKAELSRFFNSSASKASYDLKETAAFFEKMGLSRPRPAFDVRLAAYCLNPVRPVGPTRKNADWKERALWSLSEALKAETLKTRMSEDGLLKLYEDIEFPLIDVLVSMEQAGIGVDKPYLQKLSVEFEKEIAVLQAMIEEAAGFPINVDSPKQLAALLFDKIGLPVVHKTAKGGRSTDEDCLKVLALNHPLPAKILEYRELAKLKSTYVEGLLSRIDQKTGRIHTHFDQAGTETGRLSSSNPNLQNIPIRTSLGQKIRRAFIAGNGMALVSADYSQIELRVLAHVSGDAVLKEAFEKNEDIHTRTACEVFHVAPNKVDSEMRRRAKAVNFGIVYGQTAFGLSGELGIPQSEAATIIKKYFERYQGVARWIEENLASARREKATRTFLGRIRHLPELEATNTVVRHYAERSARNTPVQGAASDIIKIAMIKIHQGLSEGGQLKSKMLLQIHDELVFEAPESEVQVLAEWARKIMENSVHLSVPLVVQVKTGRDWRDMEIVK